jgi:high-affinity iron transporter
VLGYLRAQAPYEPPHESADLRTASGALRRGLAAYEKGDHAGARAQFVAAYLEGFEPHEAAIGAHDRKLVREIEAAMLELRRAAAADESVAALTRRVEHTEALLLRAEDAQRGGATALVGALTISMREGFEIALLIGALLALVRKRGLPELAKYVHAGWILAALAGLLTFYAVGAALSGFSRELAEGIATLVAGAVLLGVTHWMLGQLSAKHFMGFVARKMNAAANRRTALGILGLSFLATYREAFEVVLFMKALLLDARDQRGGVWLGIALGLAALGVCTLVLRRIGQRLQPRPFMLVSSALLALLVFALTGNGIHALQMAGAVGIHELARLPELAWLGVYPTLESAGAQGGVLLFLIGSALWPALAERRRAQQAQPAE